MKLIHRNNTRLIIILSITVLVVVLAGVAFYRIKQSSNIYRVKRTNFEAFISCKGEIQGEKATLINFPDILGDQTLDIYQLQIKDMVPEGTIVKKGDYIALLDEGRIKELTQANAERLNTATAQFNDAKIDSAVSLSSYRDEIEQLDFDLKYKKIELEQSVYESPAYQRMSKIEYDRTARLLDSKRRNYLRHKNQYKIRCGRNEKYFNELSEKDRKYQEALKVIRITAPEDGMVIYARRWRGKKTQIGDYVSRSNPVIATLPNMNSLVSETYVEEIYISKLGIGDSARVFIDALKNKELPGYISNISNIGQEMSGFDAMVFKLSIRMTGDISKLKPSMTTNNELITDSEENVLVIPLPFLFSEKGKPYVYLKNKGEIIKREVETGEKNDKFIVIKNGLKENDKILMNRPSNKDI